MNKIHSQIEIEKSHRTFSLGVGLYATIDTTDSSTYTPRQLSIAIFNIDSWSCLMATSTVPLHRQLLCIVSPPTTHLVEEVLQFVAVELDIVSTEHHGLAGPVQVEVVQVDAHPEHLAHVVEPASQ